jgi:hypothetical protein
VSAPAFQPRRHAHEQWRLLPVDVQFEPEAMLSRIADGWLPILAGVEGYRLGGWGWKEHGVVVSFRGVHREIEGLAAAARERKRQGLSTSRRQARVELLRGTKYRDSGPLENSSNLTQVPTRYSMTEPGVSELASTLQFGSIKRHPSPRHDLNPSTAASAKQPVTLDNRGDVDSDMDEDEIPISVLNPVPRKQTMPPLPDLRFEQSYLKSIEKAESWQGVAWITFRDQVRAIDHGSRLGIY